MLEWRFECKEVICTFALCDSSTHKKFQGSLYFAKKIFTIIFMEGLTTHLRCNFTLTYKLFKGFAKNCELFNSTCVLSLVMLIILNS